MRRFIFFFLVLLITGCSTTEDYHFDDKNIKISLINQWINDQYRTYSFEVENTGKLEIKYLNFYLYYPVLVGNGGSTGNPFKIEGKADISKPINLRTGEKITYSILAPIKGVFGNSKSLDFNHPQVELNGLVEQGKEDIPFEMNGGYLKMK